MQYVVLICLSAGSKKYVTRCSPVTYFLQPARQRIKNTYCMSKRPFLFLLYLQRICKDYDVLLLQETWLSNANCHIISDAFPDFSMYHNSAMEDRLQSGIRHGHPYGGTAVLIRNSICRYRQLLVTCPDICGVKCVF